MNTNDSGAGSLRQAIIDANTTGGPGSTIAFNAGVTGAIGLMSSLPPIGPNITSITNPNAGSVIIFGDNRLQGFFVYPAATTLSVSGNFQFANTASIGGNGGSNGGYGGGGALGAGGGLFVGTGANVTITGLSFNTNLAKGGDGGSGGVGNAGGGGGGGMNGGNGGSANIGAGGGGGYGAAGGSATNGGTNVYAGGGGGGLFFSGGNPGTSLLSAGGGGGGSDLNAGSQPPAGTGGNGGQGTSGAFGAGGPTGNPGQPGGNGTGTSGGGGGGGGINGSGGVGGVGGSATGTIGGGGGGGSGDTSAGVHGGSGGNGAMFGGGGGGGGSSLGGGVGSNGGAGGMFAGGGGGGVGSNSIGGNGGFGGGGGGGTTGGNGGFGGGGAAGYPTNGAGGYGAGAGNFNPGGGGAGLGGAIFVQNGGQLNISNPTGTLFINNSVKGGSGTQYGNNGQAFGPDLFLMSGSTIFFNQTVPISIPSNIEGNMQNGGGTGGAFHMAGVGGTLALGGNNTFTGTLFFDAGTVQVSNDQNLGFTGNGSVPATSLQFNGGTLEVTGSFPAPSARTVTFNAAGTIEVDSGASAEFSGPIGGAGAITKSGPGTLIFSGSNTFSSAPMLTISAGTLQINNASSFPSAVNVLNNGTIVFNNSTDAAVSGNITGSGALTMQGSAGLELSGSNNYMGLTTISSGYIQIDTANSLSPNTSVVNNAQLAFLVSAPATFANLISGSGSVTNIASGPISLTNNSNSYAGGTSFYAAGTIQITNDQQLGAATGPLTFVNGTLDLPTGLPSPSTRPINLNGTGIISVGALSATFQGNITGPGTLTKQGAGTLILQGSNNYVGTTTISAGALQIDSAGALPISGSVVDNSNLVFNNPGTATVNGLISGTGDVTMQGTGIVQLKNSSNSYSGGTFLNGGTIQVSSNADLGNAAGALNFNGGILELSGFFFSSRTINLNNPNGGTIAVDSNTFASLIGTINGPGGLSTLGPGALFLNGNNTIPTINVVTGTLIVPSSITITSTQLTIQGGATALIDGTVSSPITVVGTLEGTGTVGDAVTGVNVLGTISPGNPDGSIVPLNGTKFNFNPASTFILSLNDTMSDQIIATGDVTINNGFLRINPVNFTTPSVTSYPVITTMGTLTETSPFILINPLTRYSFSVQYNTGPMGSVVLLFNGTPIPFHVIIPSGNAGAVANCFDALMMQNLPDLTPVVNILEVMTPSQMTKAFNQMQPANFNNIAFAQENIAERMRQIYTNHFFEQRVVGCEEKAGWNLWASPFVERVQQHGTSKLPGYLEKFSGFSTAFDYRTQKHWMFTAGFSYASSELNVPNGRTEADFKTYAGTIGTAWTGSSFFADVLFSYLYSPIDAKRKIQFGVATVDLTSSVNRSAKHEDDSNQVLGHLGGGYDFKIKATKTSTYNIYPFVNVDYMYLSQDGYTEHGAGSLDLKVHDKSYDYLRPEGGIGIGYSGCFKHIEALFDLSVSYIHEFRFLGEKTSSRFKPGSCTFTVTGLKPENNLVSPTARLRLTSPKNGFSLMLGYHGEYGERFIMNAGEAELRKAF